MDWEFSTKEWKKTTWNGFFKHLKKHYETENAEAQGQEHIVTLPQDTGWKLLRQRLYF